METAKDLALKAWEDAINGKIPSKEHFENWWINWVYKNENKNTLNPPYDVFIERKRYIQLD